MNNDNDNQINSATGNQRQNPNIAPSPAMMSGFQGSALPGQSP